MEMTSDGPYAALEVHETRVLILKPGVYGSPLHGQLDTVSIKHLTPGQDFEAISYCWGSQLLPRQLFLVDHDAPLSITESLYQALQHFRSLERDLRFWIDAVSINQSRDALPERAAQVGIIAQIFGAATTVRVWLGEGDEQDALAFAVTISDVSSWKAGQEDATLAAMDGPTASCACCQLTASFFGRRSLAILRSLGRLLLRPWFTRVWTLQELAVAEDQIVICSGQHHMPWVTFRDALYFWMACNDNGYGHGQITPYVMEELQYTMQLQMRMSPFASHVQGFSVSNLLEGLVHTSTRQCYDPRDRIFGLRRPLTVEAINLLRPNYELTKCEVYRRVVIAAIEGHKAPSSSAPKPLLLFTNDITLLFGLLGTEAPDSERYDNPHWPSWVPDFHCLTKRSRQKVADYRWIDGSVTHRAEHFYAKTDTSDPHCLLIRGRRIGKVKTLCSDSICPRQHTETVHCQDQLWMIVRESLIPWYKRCLAFILAHEKDARLRSQRVQEILTAGHGAFEEFAISKKEFIDHCLPDITADIDSPPATNQIYTDMMPYLQLAIDFDTGLQLGIVQHGDVDRLAWIPAFARVGDEVCWLAGAMHPTILQAASSRQDSFTYRTLGDGWVDGLRFESEAYGVSYGDWDKIRGDEKWQAWAEKHLEWIALV